MSKDELQWLLLVASAAAIASTAEARFKAAALVELATQLDETVKPPAQEIASE